MRSENSGIFPTVDPLIHAEGAAMGLAAKTEETSATQKASPAIQGGRKESPSKSDSPLTG